MKSKIQILYKGKPYRHGSFTDDVMAVAADGLREKLLKVLEPFDDEIAEQNAEIVIIIDEQLQPTIQFNGIQDGLKARIAEALEAQEEK